MLEDEWHRWQHTAAGGAEDGGLARLSTVTHNGKMTAWESVEWKQATSETRKRSARCRQKLVLWERGESANRERRWAMAGKGWNGIMDVGGMGCDAVPCWPCMMQPSNAVTTTPSTSIPQQLN